ncbi:MAG: hypothetical protein QGH20_10695, partial [Candidatus Latescibacteria bacterium]|nr:hypothetical protein [Candidatus Latescibacterota bacterium]
MSETPSDSRADENDPQDIQSSETGDPQLSWWQKLRGDEDVEKDTRTESEILEEERQRYGMDAELEAEPYLSGLTLRTLVGALFVAVVMMPASIYLSLVVGEGLGSAAQWVSIILFAELARRSFAPLKRQEIYILFMLATSLVGGGPFFGIIRTVYLQYSQEAAALGVAERLTTENIWWAVPPYGSEAVMQRTFWHSDFFPILGMMVIGAVLGRFQTLSAHYFLFRITSDMERLPFPMAPIAAQGVTALAEGPEGESWRWRMFSTGAMAGMLFGAVYVGVPTVTGQVFGKALEIIPIPWIDFTREIGNILPGAMLGITTDIDGFIWGMVMPFPIVCGQFITTMITAIILPPFFVDWGIFTGWRPGLGVIQTSVLHSLDLWLSVGLGVGLPIMVLGFWQGGKALFKPGSARGSLDPPEGRGDVQLWIPFSIWVATSAGFVAISHWLVPDFPVWIYITFAF